MTCFVLLDDQTAPSAQRVSRLYTDWVDEVRLDDPDLLDVAWRKVMDAQCGGLHAVVLADYEWGARLAGVATHSHPGSLRVLLFRCLETLSAEATDFRLAELHGTAVADAGVVNLSATVSEDDFSQAVGRIRQAIRDGETYQVNYSYRLDFDSCGDPLSLYRQLRCRQPVGFGAFIKLPAGGRYDVVMSFSPELFLRHAAGVLSAKPMKGTAPHGADAQRNAASLAALADVKNRAENVMIVDLLRNDLGRIAALGSVSVPSLFDVETYPGVYQMTSSVTAHLPAKTGFPDVLRALFPCGSITGAPKHHTMELIQQLETEPRELYCGSIGWIDAPAAGRTCGDFCLSVAIRTVLLAPPARGLRRGRLGIGAGIVYDSVAADERAECELKGRFLTGVGANFSLIETMFARRVDGVRHLERHLSRLSGSARAMGFAYSTDDIRRQIDSLVEGLRSDEPVRLRLLLNEQGEPDLSIAGLAMLPQGPVRLLLASEALDADQLLLGHKTTLRAHYDSAITAAERQGAFDMLFFNTRGELTEGARSNVFVVRGGQWLTPALECGVLPGVMRGVLLDDPTLNAREAILTRDDLLNAEQIMVCNALRGRMNARLAST